MIVELASFSGPARRKLNLTQSEVAAAAGISQQTVSRLEHGQLERAGLRCIRGVGAALGVVLPFEPRMLGGSEVARLLDARHLAVVEAMVTRLRDGGWDVRVEHSFNHYGERGSIDVVGLRRSDLAIVLVEAKSELADAQSLIRSVDTKERVVRATAARDFGWHPRSVASIVVLPDESTQRRAAGRLANVLDAALPQQGDVIRKWLKSPKGDMRGVMFVSVTASRRATTNPGGAGRVRRSPK